MSRIVQETEKHFIKTLEKGNPIYPLFPHHVNEVERWVKRILPYYPKANKEIVLLSAWLHDIGHADGKYDIDHAIKSEKEAKIFLKSKNYPKEKLDKVTHCVRAHRCKDIQPKTIEAKILAAADSASHMTDVVYILMLSQEHLSKKEVLKKLERDYRDKNYLPSELKSEIKALYIAWKSLLKVLPEYK